MTEAELFTRVADAGHAGMCAAVASNTRCGHATLERLASSLYPVDVRVAVAGNPSAPPSLLALLADEGPDDVRRAVAGNPACDDKLRAWAAMLVD